MITRWNDGVYGEADKGHFEAWLLRFNTAIAYTDGGEVVVTENYREPDRKAVMEFAEQYDCLVNW